MRLWQLIKKEAKETPLLLAAKLAGVTLVLTTINIILIIVKLKGWL